MTLVEIKNLLSEAGIEYFIKKQNGNVVKINVLVDEEPLKEK